ncbi:hypothetical protein JBO49_15985 [Serratia fonticola]|uniref:hypothetical protein n=1 Tax=Serratia fonticola TaxID=47917 RepID=UPI00192AEEB3|nr:hypothetical protein [Serratia fonticola]MBL5862117.1 hypothetical protein [Serratia fonticola]
MEIQTTASEEQINGWLADQPEREFQRHQTSFAAMAYLGMCRHAHMSADWIAHNCLWCESCNALSTIINPTALGGAEKIISDRIEETFKNLGYIINK